MIKINLRGVAYAAVLGFATMASLALGQAPHADHARAASGAMAKPDCQQMMQMRQKMVQAEQRMDEQLQQKLLAMEKAQGTAKTDAMADVIKELVQQRQQMHKQRQEMMQSMMRHMGQHMQMGMQGEGKQAMMDCPMMKRPTTQPGGAASEGHEAHH